MVHGDAVLALLLYGLFALISTVGAFLIADHFKTRRVALISAASTMLFFVGLFLAVVALVNFLLE